MHSTSYPFLTYSANNSKLPSPKALKTPVSPLSSPSSATVQASTYPPSPPKQASNSPYSTSSNSTNKLAPSVSSTRPSTTTSSASRFKSQQTLASPVTIPSHTLTPQLTLSSSTIPHRSRRQRHHTRTLLTRTSPATHQSIPTRKLHPPTLFLPIYPRGRLSNRSIPKCLSRFWRGASPFTPCPRVPLLRVSTLHTTN